MADTVTDYFVFTDISDVVVLNPMQNVINLCPETIYVGMEVDQILQNEWFTEVYGKKRCICDTITIHEYITTFANKILINCGTICAHKTLSVEVLTKIINIMDLVYMTHGTETLTPMPIDMFAWNYVVYKHYNDRIYDGDNFTTPFNKNISDTTKCLKHK